MSRMLIGGWLVMTATLACAAGVSDASIVDLSHPYNAETLYWPTSWVERWPDAERYLGDDTPGDASNLHFPSFGAEAAKLLIEDRGVAVLGVDTASIDYGQSRDFPVHRIAGKHNVPGLENLNNLGELPPRGAKIVALPMKVEGGSGAPVRAIAVLPDKE